MFEQITRRAGRQGVKDVVGVLIHGEHHELHLGQERLELAHTFDAVHPGKIDIGEDDLWFFSGQTSDSAFGAGVLADETKALGAPNPIAQDLARLGVILNDRNRNAHNVLSIGRARRVILSSILITILFNLWRC